MSLKILVLGHNGMLGHMVFKYLKHKDLDVGFTNLRWPSCEFKNMIKNYDGDFIINCIGAIHQKTNEFEVNWELPIYLDLNSKCNIIHPGTDCEMDSDSYGVSKKIARDFIVYTSKKTKSIKTSIIGPELNSNVSLMDWFLSNKDNSVVNGYSNFFWNGNTTLTWSEQALKLMVNWEHYGKETIISSTCITKKEILESLKIIFNKNINIIDSPDLKFNKCLSGGISKPHIKKQLNKLKEFYYD